MKKFRFKLERVLDVRSIEEEEARIRLLQARRKLKEIEARLFSLRQERREVYSFVRQQNEPSARDRNYLNWLGKKIKQVEGELEAGNQLEREEKRRYQERRKKREILEKLKEKEYSKFKRQSLQREQKELDELGQRLRGKAVSS